jgi:hypothetical protein
MSVASLKDGQLQLSELVISNEKYSAASGYVASTSSFSASVDGTSLTVPEISVSGDIKCAVSSNSGTTAFNTPGLTITRNVSNSGNEFDFVAMNQTTLNGMNFYVGQPTTNPVNSTTLPKLAIESSGTTTTGVMTSSNIGGFIDIGVVGNVGATTYDTDSTLTITRNLSDGDNEFDFIAINSTTTNGMNFYASQSEVNNASKPSLTVTTTGISAPTYSGGILSGQYFPPTVVIGGNSSSLITIPSIPFNPFTGWSAATIYPQITLISEFGGIGINSLGVTNNGDGTADIIMNAYNPTATAEEIFSVNYLLVSG